MCINKINDLKVIGSKDRVFDQDFGMQIEQELKMKGRLEDGSEVEVLISYKGSIPSEVIGGAVASGQINRRLKITLESEKS